MPVYNAGRHLAEAVESILAQTYNDFEFLIHDDGSNDGSLGFLRGAAQQDTRIDVSTGQNAGPGAARNTLVDRARGEYLAVMDADDICYPKRLERQIAYLDAHPECVVLGGWAIMVDEHKRPIVPLMPPLDHEVIDAGNLSGQTSFVHPSVIMRRQALLDAGRYDPRYSPAEDKELWLRMAEIGRLANIPEFLVKYRMHETSVSTKSFQLQRELSQQASAEAAMRRGISNPYQRENHRSDGSHESELNFALNYGWQAWSWGFRATSRHFALRALHHDPLSLAAWKLLAFGSLKRSPKTLDITL
jgi:glycosyltransferase involved in cell wall biosynthesis